MNQILTVAQINLQKRAKVIQTNAQATFGSGLLVLCHDSEPIQAFAAWGDQWIGHFAQWMIANPSVLFSVQHACGLAAEQLLNEAMGGAMTQEEEAPDGP